MIKYYVRPKQYADSIAQAKLMEALNQAGIVYESFEDSGNLLITWLKRDDQAVDNIENPKTMPRVSFSDLAFEKEFLQALDAAKVKHAESVDKENRRWITWDERDRQKATEIFEDLRKKKSKACVQKNCAQ